MANGRAQYRGPGYVLREISRSLDGQRQKRRTSKPPPRAKFGLQALDNLNEPVAPAHLASPLPNYGRSSRESRV